jgi:hypothetical protein
MVTLEFLGRLAVSIILMTATCTRALERLLFEKLGRKVYQVLRRSTDRPEIAHQLIPVRVDWGNFEEAVAERIISLVQPLQGAERALLFCNSRDECDRMAKLLRWLPYHSSISMAERSQAMKRWKNGSVFGLVCTSMLNCCLDYSHVRFVFHLGPPRDVFDYYQAIGRLARGGGIGQSVVYFDPSSLRKPRVEGNDLFGENIIHNMMQDTSLCRRLRPSFFLDGVGVPCAMLPKAQLCDTCTAQLSCPPPDPGLHCIPAELPPTSHLQPDSSTSHHFPGPINHPAPLASFSHHLAAANAYLGFGKTKPTSDEELGRYIHVACNVLAKSCVNCWCHGLECRSHTLAECDLRSFGESDKEWQKWVKLLRFPVGCCFYCGCPQKVCLHHAVQMEHSFLPVTADCLRSKFWPEASCPRPSKRPDVPLGYCPQATCPYYVS